MRWLRRLLRRLRPRVPAGTRRHAEPGLRRRGDDEDGGAGVREPRVPSPSPRGMGGAATPPPDPQTVSLKDARQ